MVNQRRVTYVYNRKRGKSFLYWLVTINMLFYSSLSIGIIFVLHTPVALAGEPEYIIITDEPNGIELTTVNIPVGGQITVYASAYMNGSYMGLWQVNWTADNPSLGSFNNLTGSSSTFTTGIDPGIVDINGSDGPYPAWADNFTAVILNPTVDYIAIMDSPGGLGNDVASGTFSVNEVDTFYAAGFNNTSNYVEDVEAAWESDHPSVGQVISPGISTTFGAQLVDVDSTCTVTATYGGIMTDSTGLLTVLAPTTDYVQIRSADEGGGVALSNPANWPTYRKGTVTMFYGTKYNDTVGYFGPVPVTSTWDSNSTSIVEVTSPGNNTTITCSDLNIGWVWVILDDPEGHTAQTKVTVMDLTVDYIQIRDTQGGGGNVVGNPSYPVGDGTTFYGAIYNYSAGYIGEISVDWEVTGGIGTVNPNTGISTKFTATTEGEGIITATYYGITNSTGTITVNPADNSPDDNSETSQISNNLILYGVIIVISAIVIAAYLIIKSRSAEKQAHENARREAAELESEIQKMKEKGVKTIEIEKILQDTKSQLGETDVQEKN